MAIKQSGGGIGGVPIPNPLKPYSAQDPIVLLAMCIWGEARGEPLAAKYAVGCVIRNRVNRHPPEFGMGYTGVILKPRQFSCFNSDDPNAPKLIHPLQYGVDVWTACYRVAVRVFSGEAVDETNGATHYFVDGSPRPSWADAMTATARIGAHGFFRDDLHAVKSPSEVLEAQSKIPATGPVIHVPLPKAKKPDERA